MRLRFTEPTLMNDRSLDELAKQLTPRRREALHWLLEGLTERAVADRMFVSPATVHQYVGEIYRHFDVSSRAELLALFLRHGRM